MKKNENTKHNRKKYQLQVFSTIDMCLRQVIFCAHILYPVRTS